MVKVNCTRTRTAIVGRKLGAVQQRGRGSKGVGRRKIPDHRCVSQIIYGGVGFRRDAPLYNYGPLVPFQNCVVFTVSQNLNPNHL